MSVEPSAFLLKEQELMKLNEEINLKTKSVLNRSKPVPASKSKPKDVKIQVTHPNGISKHNDSDDQPQDSSTKPAISKNVQSIKSAVIPLAALEKEKKSLSSEGLIKFLKSKVTILQDEIDIHQKEGFKKAEEVQLLSQKMAKLEQQREQMNTKNNCLQAKLKEDEEKIIELELKVKERDNDTNRLGKEGEASKRDLKTLQQSNAMLEKRLLCAQNEIEALKVNLAGAYDREKELRVTSTSQRDSFEKQIKQLRKQRVSLITAYKQQLLLLDNLKRQNLCLEEAKMLDFSEKEFTKILNWEK